LGGSLFDRVTHARRPLGDVFYSFTHAISPGVDLLAVRVIADPPVGSDTGQSQTTTLRLTASNIGNVSVTQPIAVAFYAGWPPSGTLIGMQTITAGLPGCAESVTLSQTWPDLGVGAHPMYVDVNPVLAVSETSYSNNRAAGMFLVAEYSSFLPIVHR
jgi:hypothetical protein